MKILIKESGETKEIKMMSTPDGVDYSNDFIGPHFSGDHHEGAALMPVDEYDWWSRVCAGYESACARCANYRATLDDAAEFDKHMQDSSWGDNDLEDNAAAMIQALEDF